MGCLHLKCTVHGIVKALCCIAVSLPSPSSAPPAHTFAPSGAIDPVRKVLRLMCASEAASTEQPYASLTRIRDQSLAFNAERSVHAALLYMSGWYLQWLEGREADVMQVVTRTTRARSHARLRVLHYGFGPRLLGDAWCMGLVQRPEARGGVAERVNQLRAQLVGGKQFSPLSVWRRVTMPMQAGESTGSAMETPHCRVLISSALPHQAHAFVSWAAERTAAQVIEHRYAGEHTPDVGLAYADCTVKAVCLRLVAAARHCLSLGLSKAMHCDFTHWVCLFANDPTRDAELLQRAIDTFRDVDATHRPEIVGVASDPGVHAWAQVVLAQAGFLYRPHDTQQGGGNRALFDQLRLFAQQAPSTSGSIWPMAE